MADEIFTSEASPNIAFIKYWGKRPTGQNIPNNSSISMTLDQSVLSTRTSALLSDRLDEDKLFINGEAQKIIGPEATEKSKYISKVIDYLRGLAKTDSRLLIVSKNSFPTGAGIASSASGAVALVEALVPALGLDLDQAARSDVARLISGSACRSSFGGIVKWDAGSSSDGSDSHARQVFDEHHWPDLIDLIAIVNESTKKVSSSEGHALTVKTSVLYKERPAFAEEGVKRVIEALSKRDLNQLTESIMRDSNNMHATMMDTWPPIMYLTDTSKDVIYAVHELNREKGRNIAGYTFDAGPNPHIITTEQYKTEVLDALSKVSGIARTIVSHAGSGPRLLREEDALIDLKTLGPTNGLRKTRI